MFLRVQIFDSQTEYPVILSGTRVHQSERVVRGEHFRSTFYPDEYEEGRKVIPTRNRIECRADNLLSDKFLG